jgi:hypothetical protein
VARRENEQRVFSRAEQALCAALIIGAVGGVIGLVGGGITI